MRVKLRGAAGRFEARAKGHEIVIFEPQGPRWTPVMKLVQAKDEPTVYEIHRMTYRREGGWSYPLDHGPLPELLHYLDHLGRESFFDLM